MGFMVKGSEGGNYTPAPEGNHRAVCTRVVDLGTQPGGQWGPKRKVRLTWELTDEIMEYTDRDGIKRSGPYLVSKSYNLTLGVSQKPSLLRADLESWRGKPFTAEEETGFDLAQLLNAPCLVNVVHEEGNNGKLYANIKSVARLPKGMERPQANGETIYFNFDEWDGVTLPPLSDKMLDVLRTAPEWTTRKALAAGPGEPAHGDDGEDIPF